VIKFESTEKLRGELDSDAKLTATRDGGTACKLNIRMPVTTKESEPEYHKPFLLQVTAFGALGKQCAVLKQGIGVAVHGRLHATRYRGTKGDHRASLGVIAEAVGCFLEATDDAKWFSESNQTAAYDRGDGKKEEIKGNIIPSLDNRVDAFLTGQPATTAQGVTP
jgi:single-stranded DNA-binding protein